LVLVKRNLKDGSEEHYPLKKTKQKQKTNQKMKLNFFQTLQGHMFFILSKQSSCLCDFIDLEHLGFIDRLWNWDGDPESHQTDDCKKNENKVIIERKDRWKIRIIFLVPNICNNAKGERRTIRGGP
jgi:hypothetical protein